MKKLCSHSESAFFPKLFYIGTGVAAAALTSILIANAQPSGRWMAIANDETGNWGSAIGESTSEAAQSAAISACHGTECKVVNVGVGNCLAYAESQTNPRHWGAAIAQSINKVESDAEQVCSSHAPQTCHVLYSKCDVDKM